VPAGGHRLYSLLAHFRSPLTAKPPLWLRDPHPYMAKAPGLAHRMGLTENGTGIEIGTAFNIRPKNLVFPPCARAVRSGECALNVAVTVSFASFLVWDVASFHPVINATFLRTRALAIFAVAPKAVATTCRCSVR
jgi:hypothetical protein